METRFLAGSGFLCNQVRRVSIVGTGQIPVQREAAGSLRELGAQAARLALQDAGVETVDALFVSNMLADELQDQKHVATLIASETGLHGIEALEIRAATASGAAALRMAYFAVASGEAELALAVGVEKMGHEPPTAALAKALDAEREIPLGGTLISQSAYLMRLYLEAYQAQGVKYEDFANFAVNAHHNAVTNPQALFRREITSREVVESRVIVAPLRLFDCAPVCDGAAGVVLAPEESARALTPNPVKILASAVATDWLVVADRPDPLAVDAARLSVQKAYERAGVTPADVDFLEAHDAFSIMTCLLMEAAGFAERGEGWRLAAEGEIFRTGRLPVSTLGGLKARGHPIGATALYQTCEIVQQLTGRAGPNQLPSAEVAMLQSVGGAAGTVLTHLFGT